MSTLPLWQHPSNYAGATWEGWLVSFSRTWDSSILEESNFTTALRELSALFEIELNGEQTVRVVREGHWACGWLEWIAIHPSNVAAVKLGEELAERCGEYPILDEETFSAMEQAEVDRMWADMRVKMWADMSVKERLIVIQEYAPEGYIVAARHDYFPYSVTGAYDRLDMYLRDSVQ